ncbi:MAG: DegT/DnrJ/EryC1/StrS family aminotransferase [Butyrivibrio sp.]|nr:DegT/DnrJ/EryC1/StrS family aminotransferase [Butyrivibrio sp.]
MTDEKTDSIIHQPRFNGIFVKGGRFERKIRLTNSFELNNVPLQLKEPLKNISDGSFIAKLENQIASYLGVSYTVATSSGASAMHLALKLAVKKMYGADTLNGKRVFCPDLCNISNIMSVLYEDGVPTFIDADDFDYNMAPECLENAFNIYPDTKIVIVNHIYGYPARIDLIKAICHEHGALLIEDASESFGAKINGSYTGSFGDIAVLDFGKDKLIHADSGGMIITQDYDDACQIRQFLGKSKVPLPWEWREEETYEYKMSELSAAVLLPQIKDIDYLIRRKKEIYEYYKENLDEELINPITPYENTSPNYWMIPVLCDSSIEAHEVRKRNGYSYEDIHGTASAMEIVDALNAFGAEAVPAYVAMSMQEVFKDCELITTEGKVPYLNPYEEDNRFFREEVGRDVSKGAVCLPTDSATTEEELQRITEIVHSCFDKQSIGRMAIEKALE